MKRVFLLVLVLALLLSTFVASAQSDINCAAPDYSGVTAAATQANSALSGGDMATYFQSRTQASQLYHVIQSKCVLEPLAAQFGVDAATIQKIEAMPTCQYVFDATVRAGADKGANVHGTLSLLQNSPTTAVGYVFTGPDTTGLVPVAADLGADKAITLTFTLPQGDTIVGTGVAGSSITNCFGAIQGQLTGPGTDDKGDWLGSAYNCLNDPLPCLPDTVMPKPQQPPSGGACTADATPACQVICTDGTCKLTCAGSVGKICTGK